MMERILHSRFCPRSEMVLVPDGRASFQFACRHSTTLLNIRAPLTLLSIGKGHENGPWTESAKYFGTRVVEVLSDTAERPFSIPCAPTHASRDHFAWCSNRERSLLPRRRKSGASPALIRQEPVGVHRYEKVFGGWAYPRIRGVIRAVTWGQERWGAD